MARLLLILALVAVAFWVYTIVDCVVQPASRHRGVGKGIWILIVVLLPVVGGILWLAIGRLGKSARRIPQAPDDDPAFLSRIGSTADQDERIRRLEEELAQLDAEDDDPKWNPPDVPPATGAAAEGTIPPPGTTPGREPDGDDTRGQRGAIG